MKFDSTRKILGRFNKKTKPFLGHTFVIQETTQTMKIIHPPSCLYKHKCEPLVMKMRKQYLGDLFSPGTFSSEVTDRVTTRTTLINPGHVLTVGRTSNHKGSSDLYGNQLLDWAGMVVQDEDVLRERLE